MTNKPMLKPSNNTIITNQAHDLAAAGQIANQTASDYLFADYQQRRAKRTAKTQLAALLLWVQFLHEAHAAAPILATSQQWAQHSLSPVEKDHCVEYATLQQQPLALIHSALYCQRVPAAWQGVTWGLVEGFVKWLLNTGYSIASVNNRLSAIKIYTRLAAKAGIIPPTEQALIREVKGYGLTEGKRVDEARPRTRIGYKKEEAIVLTVQQAKLFKTQHPPTPQGIRDRLLICLLLDLGIRASEVAALTVEDFIEPGYVVVHREKTDTVDRMALSRDVMQAMVAYKPYLRPRGTLLRGSRKNEKLTDQVMSVRAVGSRIKTLGRDILGVWELSPHDLRHTWATHAAKKSNPFILRDAGGWTNMQTPGRYVERNKVVNEGIQLEY